VTAVPVRHIVGFHQDEHGDWVAVLSCGHSQHLRHRPPFFDRPWVLTDAGRRARIGAPIECSECADTALDREPASRDGAYRQFVTPVAEGGACETTRTAHQTERPTSLEAKAPCCADRETHTAQTGE
jgi:hypothetical protein